MVCKKCGYEVLDENATYCGVCGSRLDGKKTCPSCKKPNEENVTYCVYCGERMDGKTVCSACNTTYEGRFCPSCGKSAPWAMAQRSARSCNKEKGFKIFDLIGSGLMMLGVLFSLIFVFFIAVSADVSLINMQELGGDTSVSIFDYFGKYYDEMGEYPIEINWLSDTMSNQELIIGIFGTVLVALTLCAVVGFAIVASVIFVRNWMRLSERKADIWAAATILSFLAGVVLFYGLHKLMVDYTAFTLSFKLSGATVCGVVLCSVTLVGSIACKIVGKGNEIVKPKKLVGVCLSLLGVAFCATLFALLGNFSIISKMTANSESFQTAAGALTGNILLITCAELKLKYLPRGIKTDLVYSNVDTFTILNIVNQVLLILAVVAIVLCIIQKLNNLFSQKQGSVLPWAILAVVLTVACLVLSIIANNCVNSICEVDLSLPSDILARIPDVKGSIVMPILLVVFSVLNLATVCVQSALNAKWKKESKAE